MNSYSKFELVITESKKAGSQCTSRTQKQNNKICLKLAKKTWEKKWPCSGGHCEFHSFYKNDGLEVYYMQFLFKLILVTWSNWVHKHFPQ